MDNTVKLNLSLQKIYKLGVTNSSIIFSNELVNFMIFLFFMFIIFYWYLHNQIAYSRSDWDKMKCDPKYLFISGYIKPEGTMTSAETTNHNYKQCISRGYKNYINDLKNEYYYEDINRNKILNNEKELYDAVFKNKNKRSQKLNVDIEQLQNNIDSSLNLTGNSSLTYNHLRNVGLYLDQFDMLLNYINTYVKNYLTYLYLYHTNNADNMASPNYTNSGKVKQILDKYFDGPSFY